MLFKAKRIMRSFINNKFMRLASALLNPHKFVNNEILKHQLLMYGKAVNFEQSNIDKNIFTSKEEHRIKYYLGNMYENKVDANQFKKDHSVGRGYIFARTSVLTYSNILINSIVSFDQGKKGYLFPIINIFNILPNSYKKVKFIFLTGDNAMLGCADGIIAKTRIINDKSVTLLKLKPQRHWKLAKIKSMDISYQDKKDMAVWRGGTTGRKKMVGQRLNLVSKLFSNTHQFDVGFSKTKNNDPAYNHLGKGFISIEEQLKYKILISLEGNDVASGLKWMLLSNSVVMMPSPTICSWAMEDTLEPFVHYIPLDHDFSNIEKQVAWALDNESECIEISNNASQYMSQFLDPYRETLIEREVMKRYLDNIC